MITWDFLANKIAVSFFSLKIKGSYISTSQYQLFEYNSAKLLIYMQTNNHSNQYPVVEILDLGPRIIK